MASGLGSCSNPRAMVEVRVVMEGVVNRIADLAGVRVERCGATRTLGGRKITDEQVIRLASEAGVSPGAYVEAFFGRSGRADEIIGHLVHAGALASPPEGSDAVLCEIGPGSGLYIEKVLELVRPRRYEVYELARNRAEFLERTFPVVALPTDGESLAATPDGSVALVHAHGVFVSLKLMTSFRYFEEMARVVGPGGWAVFDITSEDCVDPETVERWLASNLRYARLLPRARIVEFFAGRGFELMDEFRLPLLVQGSSRYLAFQRVA